MKLADFAKSKKELEKQKEKNNQPFLQYDEQYRMAKTNQTEYKVWTTAFFSLLSYLLLFIGTAISLSITDAPLFASVPRLLYPVAILGGSVGLGTIARVWMEKKFKLKERLRAFTNAKTDTEKLVEEIKNEIELKKLETRNLALAKTTEQLDNDEKKLRGLSEKYIFDDKETRSQESSKEKSLSLTSLLQEKYTLLDSLVAKKVICDRFFHQRQTDLSVMDTMIATVGSGVGALMYYTLTLMIASTHIAGPLAEGTTGLLALFIPALLTGTVAGIFHNVKNKHYKKAFATLNETLKEEALPAKSKDTFEERQALENLIDQTLTEIVSATIGLLEERRFLDSFNMSDDSSEEPMQEKVHVKELPQQVSQSVCVIEEDLESPALEEPIYEVIPTHSCVHREIKTLTKRRK